MRSWIAGLVGVLALTGCGVGHPAMNAAALPGNALQAQGHRAHPKQGLAVPMPDRYAEVVNTHHDLIFRGGVPNDDQLKALFETGVSSEQAPGAPLKIETIVNLLDPTSKDGPSIQHESEVAQAHHVKFVNIALPWGTVTPTSMVQTWFDTVEAARANHTALYIHCTHGRDRTGSMVAVYREQFDGWAPQKALDEMESPTFNYDPKPYPWITQFVLDFKPLATN